MMAQALMRTECGKLELDELFHNRKTLNSNLLDGMKDACTKWRCNVLRYEVTDIKPDPMIAKAMDRQAAAERNRREQVLEATAKKQGMVEVSEGQRQKDINESEGMKIRILNETSAKATTIRELAQAEADATKMKASAQAEALAIVGKSLANEEGKNALKANLSSEYFKSFEKIVQSSNTVVLPQDVGSVDSVIGRAVTLMGGLAGGKDSTSKKDESTDTQ
eukprot:CAMPEP_0168525890 /NCGR_PEP_ID=MMETSP0405-20121227/11597_1 /TAXON_ID=498012 /ORGANISM="Trichosphaerium sp, Strain Am-I-7 wt" /LENGTH=220 /DNA_ID=CAMNT_0008548539 /DNA_START=374 /DNA_END=1036 /DNA_ORIENTATION=-